MRSLEIANHRDKYIIYENGNVLSRINNNVLSPVVNNNGYLVVKLESIVYSVHRLVAQHFIPNPYDLPQVNHIDGDKSNNHFSNLEWCTSEHNNQHALKAGLRKGFVPYDTKLALMHRAINGELISDLVNEVAGTHPNTLSKMLRQTAKKEGLEAEWKTAMKLRRRNVAIRNLPQ